MPLIVTPRQLRQRGELYHQLDQLVSAGVTLLKAVEIQYKNPPGREFRKPLGKIIDLLNQGCTFSEALRQTDGWFPAFDIALLQAGESSGRLDQCFKLLANYCQDRARMAKEVISGMAYPTLVLHMAVFIFPLPTLLAGNYVTYAAETLGVLIPIYCLVGFIIYAAQSGHAENWRALIEKILRPIPLLGTARHYLALARLTAALEALLNAGVGLVEAWNLAAAAASGSPILRRTVAGWRTSLLSGQTPAELVRNCNLFPDAFSNLYATGEVSGKLDDSLRGLHRYYQEDGSNKMMLVAQWTPRLLYGIIALVVAYKIVAFYSGYFQQIQNAEQM